MQYVFLFCFLFVTSINAQSNDIQPELTINHLNAKGGIIPEATFRLSNALIIRDDGTRMGKCQLLSYEVTRVRKGEDPYSYVNMGAAFNSKVLDLVKNAKYGDIFYFDDMRGRCPGDDGNGAILSIVFHIK